MREASVGSEKAVADRLAFPRDDLLHSLCCLAGTSISADEQEVIAAIVHLRSLIEDLVLELLKAADSKLGKEQVDLFLEGTDSSGGQNDSIRFSYDQLVRHSWSRRCLDPSPLKLRYWDLSRLAQLWRELGRDLDWLASGKRLTTCHHHPVEPAVGRVQRVIVELLDMTFSCLRFGVGDYAEARQAFALRFSGSCAPGARTARD